MLTIYHIQILTMPYRAYLLFGGYNQLIYSSEADSIYTEIKVQVPAFFVTTLML